MKQWYFVKDIALCHDCNNCFMACKDEHVDNEWPGYTAPQPRHGHRWLNLLRHERGQYPRIDVSFLSLTCQHCQNAPCVKAGNGAVARRDDGIVMIDMEKAKGKKGLVDSCPYGAIYWNEEENVAQKCTMCAHLLDDEAWTPGLPRCVHNCPTGSLKALKIEPAEMEKIVADEGLANYKADLGTRPNVYYKNLHTFTSNFISAGVLVDGDCFENATVVLKCDGTVVATEFTNCFGDFKFDGLDNGEYVVDIDAAGKKTSETVTLDSTSRNLGFIKL